MGPSDANRIVLSVMGPHANEDTISIFHRKIDDIARIGKTLWLCASPSARPDRTQTFLSGSTSILFLAPASRSGARPTTSAEAMTELSPNRLDWESLPAGLGPVTGRRVNAYAFVLSELTLCEPDHLLDLWQYVDAEKEGPIRFRLGSSTLLARRSNQTEHPMRMKSRIRRVLAVGRLEAPYAVWVR